MRSADRAPSHLYVPGLAEAGDAMELPEEESRYLARVCRARVGDPASATDGAGVVARVRVTAIGRAVQVAIESRGRVERARTAWLLCGAPEGTRADWLVEKLAELGIAELHPVDGERGAWDDRPARRERLERIAIAALRQSRRAHLMTVRPACALAAALDRIPAGATCWRCGVEAAPGPAGPAGPAGEVRLEVAAVGPASGFAAAEVALLDARGFTGIRLADARLRTETAAVAWAAGWASRARSGPAPGAAGGFRPAGS